MRLGPSIIEDTTLDPGPSHEARTRSAAHAALARVLPELEQYGLRLVPEHRAGSMGVSGEDLVQVAALAVLSVLESELGRSSSLPRWWQDDGRLFSYLRGIMWRHLKRVLRDRRETGASLALELVAEGTGPGSLIRREDVRCDEVRCEERARVRACLAGVLASDLRLFAHFGRGRSYESLASRSGLSSDALAKRRARALADLRQRCLGCARRREHGCPWIPRGWLGAKGAAPTRRRPAPAGGA